jgi:serine/threonine-protein kinase
METTDSKPRARMLDANTLVAEAYCPSCERSFPEAMERCPDDGSKLVRLAERQDTLIGSELDGRFLLERRIGVGGMGTVYRARTLADDSSVAVKVIRELATDLVTAKRFLREAKLASRLHHENVVRIFEFGQTPEGVLYLSMELVEGTTLEDLIVSYGTLAPAAVCKIAGQMFDALECAHQSGIVHRDLKPSNVMVLDGPDQTVKVLDFGLAKSLGGDFTTTDAGSIMGTPAYLAPELVLGREVTPAVDLYAVGVVLYELLSGDLPFTDDDVPAVLMAHAYRPPPPLPESVPMSLANLVMRLLAKKADERFPSAAAAREAFRFAVAATESVTRPAFVEAKTEEQTVDEVHPDDLIEEDDDEEGEGTLRSHGPIFDAATTESMQRVRDSGDVKAAHVDDAPTAPVVVAENKPAGKSAAKTLVDEVPSGLASAPHYRKTKQLVAISAEDLIFEVAAAAAEASGAHSRAEIARSAKKTRKAASRSIRWQPFVFAALFCLGFLLVWLLAD